MRRRVKGRGKEQLSAVDSCAPFLYTHRCASLLCCAVLCCGILSLSLSLFLSAISGLGCAHAAGCGDPSTQTTVRLAEIAQLIIRSL